MKEDNIPIAGLNEKGFCIAVTDLDLKIRLALIAVMNIPKDLCIGLGDLKMVFH